MDINFIYEVKNGKYIIGEKKGNIINNKQYYFGNLGNLEIQEGTELYLDDLYFNFQVKSFVYDSNKKINLKEIENNLKEFNKFIGYTVLNIYKNGTKNKFILGESGRITYDIGVYNIDSKKYNEILKHFGKNIKLDIFPNSFFLIKNIGENIGKGTILYLLKNSTKLINIEKGFYKNIEKIDIGIEQFENKIIEIYGKKLNTIDDMGDFSKKVYTKELENFLEPIKLFLENSLLNKNIYIIGDFKHTPGLLKNLGDNIKANIIPIRIDNKTFKNIEKADIYCILKK